MGRGGKKGEMGEGHGNKKKRKSAWLVESTVRSMWEIRIVPVGRASIWVGD